MNKNAPDWDTRFSEPGFAYGTEPNDFLASVVERIPPGRVVCIGDGEGRNGVFLATRGFDVTSVDQSAVGLAKARGLASERGVTIATVQADLAEYKFPQGLSAVVSIFCHLPRELRRAVHHAAAEALAPGGVIVLEAYSPEQLAHGTGGPKIVELLLTLDDLRSDFPALELEHAQKVERDVVEGRLHTGRASVVQLVGRKPR